MPPGPLGKRRPAVLAGALAAKRSRADHRPLRSRLCNPDPTLNPASASCLNPDPLLDRQQWARDAGSIPAASTGLVLERVLESSGRRLPGSLRARFRGVCIAPGRRRASSTGSYAETRSRALLGSLAANLVAVQGHAILECSVLKQVTLQRFGDLVEQRSARSQDRRVGVEQ